MFSTLHRYKFQTLFHTNTNTLRCLKKPFVQLRDMGIIILCIIRKLFFISWMFWSVWLLSYFWDKNTDLISRIIFDDKGFSIKVTFFFFLSPKILENSLNMLQLGFKILEKLKEKTADFRNDEMIHKIILRHH